MIATPKEAKGKFLDSIKLALETIMSHSLCVLGTELRCSARTMQTESSLLPKFRTNFYSHRILKQFILLLI